MAFVDDLHDDAPDDTWRLTAAWLAAGDAARDAEEEPRLWHDLARQWLGAHRPDRRPAASSPLPLFAGEVAERRDAGEGHAAN